MTLSDSRARGQEETLLGQLLWLQCAPCASPQVSYCVLSLGFLTHAARALVAARPKKPGRAVRRLPGKATTCCKQREASRGTEGLSLSPFAASSGEAPWGNGTPCSGGQTSEQESLFSSSQSASTNRANGEHTGEALPVRRLATLERSSPQRDRSFAVRDPEDKADTTGAAPGSRASTTPLTAPGTVCEALSRAASGELNTGQAASFEEPQSRKTRKTRRDGASAAVPEADAATGKRSASGEALLSPRRDRQQGAPALRDAWQEATVESNSGPEPVGSPQGGTAFRRETGPCRGASPTAYPEESPCEETRSQDSECAPGRACEEDSVTKAISQVARRLLRVQDRRQAAAATALANYGIEGPVSGCWVDRLDETFGEDSEVVFGSLHTRPDSGSPVSRGKKKREDKERRERGRESHSRRAVGEGEDPDAKAAKGRKKKGSTNKRTGKDEAREESGNGKTWEEVRDRRSSHSPESSCPAREKAITDELAGMPCVVSVVTEVVGAGVRGKKRRSAVASIEFEAYISRVETCG